MNTTATFTPSETENAVEIACDCIEYLQDHIELGRDTLMREYIFPWAREAEIEWQMRQAISKDDTPYYDFIMAFSDRKKAEVAAQQKAGGIYG